MQYQAVLFDLDGTLIDSLADLGESANAVLKEQGFPVHAIETYRQMVGNGMRELMRRCLPESASLALADEMLGRFKCVYEARLLQKTRPYEGVLTLLSALRERGIPLAVCTNKEHRAALTLVDALFPAGTFAYVFGERDGVRRKPDPEAVLDIAGRLGVPPSAAIYAGDSLVDMQTAVRAGMLPVGVLWGFREREELEAHGGKIILSEPMELLEKVEFSPKA